MEILNDYMVNSCRQDSIAILLVISISALAVALIYFAVMYCEIGATIRRLIGGVICLCLLGASVYGLVSIKPSLHRIDVIFTEDISVIELSEKFEFIGQRGRIYTLQYKED